MEATDGDAAQAQAGEAAEDREPDRVQRSERHRVPRGEVRRQQQDGHREPEGIGAHRDAVAVHDVGRRGDESGGAEQCVQSPGRGAQQEVARNAQHSSGAQDLEAEPRLLAHGVHPAAVSGSPPKRRCRLRSSPIAAARSAGPKSGQ